MFIRTIALFAFVALSSQYSSPVTPTSSTAIQLANNVFMGFSLTVAIQCLLGAAMRPAGQWEPEPPKTVGEQEVADGTVPGDHVGTRKRADSIPLSPTKSTFSGSEIRIEQQLDEDEPVDRVNNNPFRDQ